jgi:hypothetical protein
VIPIMMRRCWRGTGRSGGSTYLLSDARRDGVLAVRARSARDPLFEHSRTAGTPSLLCRDSDHDEKMLVGNSNGSAAQRTCYLMQGGTASSPSVPGAHGILYSDIHGRRGRRPS